MPDLFQHVAALIVDLRPFGLPVTQAEVLEALRKDFKDEAALQSVLDRLCQRIEILRWESNRRTPSGGTG